MPIYKYDVCFPNSQSVIRIVDFGGQMTPVADDIIQAIRDEMDGQVIREINNSGTTILLVEQNAAMALKVAHRAYVIEVGSIEMEGPAAELASSDEVRKAYLGAH